MCYEDVLTAYFLHHFKIREIKKCEKNGKDEGYNTNIPKIKSSCEIFFLLPKITISSKKAESKIKSTRW